MSRVKEPLEATAYFSKGPTVQIEEPILVGIQASSGCQNRIAQARWLNNRKNICSQFWSLEVQNQETGRAGC